MIATTYDPQLDDYLEKSAERHGHLCPRQVIGVRMGIYAGQILGLSLPQTNKRLLTFVETDGCFVDGIEVATGCAIGRRTLRFLDYGKVAATFVDTRTENAIRIVPHLQSREFAQEHSPEARSRWHQYLLAYQRLPYDCLFTFEKVQLTQSLSDIISHAKYRVNCHQCGEEIINQREIMIEDQAYCRACTGNSYYNPIDFA